MNNLRSANPAAERANAEHAFKQTRLDFTSAVYQLTARTPVPGTDGEVLSILEQIQADMFQTRTDTPPSQAFKTRPPVWLDGNDWLNSIAAALNTLAANTGCSNRADTLADRLHRADGYDYAPPDTGDLDAAIHTFQQALQHARALLNPPQFTIAATCPACNTRWVDRPDTHHVDTLQARENAITCQNCGAQWAGVDVWKLADHVAAQSKD